MAANAHTIFPTIHDHLNKLFWVFSCALIAVVPLLSALSGSVFAAGPNPYPGSSHSFSSVSQKSSLLEGRFGYLWGVNEILFRDGDNANIPPGKKEVRLDSLVFGVQGETFLMRDLAVRAQWWINIPEQRKGDFALDRQWRPWDSKAQYLEADLSAIYHLGLGGMPYTAGLVAGYRYNYFDYRSHRMGNTSETFQDQINVHIPYLGVYYAHGGFVGSVVRLDVLASPFTLSRVDGEQHLTDSVTRVKGHSLTGFWFESLFGWSWPISDNALVGTFAKYSYLELSGGATLERGLASTRFSMDSRHHLVVVGLSATYTF